MTAAQNPKFSVFAGQASRRTLLAGVIGTPFVLAGCSKTEQNPQAEAAKTRTVTDLSGKVEIPANPKRIVVTHSVTTMAALGLAPIGARNLHTDMAPFPKLLPMMKDSTDLGGGKLNVEQVLSLNPDLIIATMPNFEAELPRLKKIAPTVTFQGKAMDRKHRWPEMMAFYAEVTGTQAKAAELMKGYRDRCQQFKDTIGKTLAGKKISVLRIAKNNIQIYTMGSFCGGVLRDAGVPRPESQNLTAQQTYDLTKGEENERIIISPERLREADADVLFVISHSVTDPATRDDWAKTAVAHYEKVVKHPLWNTLNAVKNKRAFLVGEQWNGESVLDANVVLDDLFKHLGKA